jgi:hypothetical protein
MIFSAAVLPALEGWDVLAETAQDLAILSLGATGAVFDNPRVEQAFESHAALVALGLMAANLIFSAIVVYMRAKRAKVSRSFFIFWWYNSIISRSPYVGMHSRRVSLGLS